MQILTASNQSRRAGAERLRDASRRAFAVLDRAEVVIVHAASRNADRHGLIPVARALTWAGNGWLYPVLAVWIAAVMRDAFSILAASAGSLAIVFTIYPQIKRVLARSRPCDVAGGLARRAAPPLDRYSCPSGHAMTAAAFLTPVMFYTSPVLTPLVAAVWVSIAWSRVALGHHYLSDVVLGSVLGSAVASTVVAVM